MNTVIFFKNSFTDVESDETLPNKVISPAIKKSFTRYSRHPVFWTFVISNFFFGFFSTLGNCPYKFVRYLEHPFLELSLCLTIFLVPSALFRTAFHLLYLECFHFTHLNVERKHYKTLIECLSFHISTCWSRKNLMPKFEAI